MEIMQIIICLLEIVILFLFSLIEAIEKKVITNRILPISRGREEVEYLKFKRFAPGTEQRIRIEKSSR